MIRFKVNEEILESSSSSSSDSLSIISIVGSGWNWRISKVGGNIIVLAIRAEVGDVDDDWGAMTDVPYRRTLSLAACRTLSWKAEKELYFD